MKTISISDWAHEKITAEIDEARKAEKLPLPTCGSIIDEEVYKRNRRREKAKENKDE